MTTCIRCAGTGVFGDFGTCFRCDGTGRDPGRLRGRQEFRQRATARAATQDDIAALRANSARRAANEVRGLTRQLRAEFAPLICEKLGVRSVPMAQLDAFIVEHRV